MIRPSIGRLVYRQGRHSINDTVEYIGCAVLLCLNCCLFDLACFFLPSFSSLIKHVYPGRKVREIARDARLRRGISR